MEIRRRNLLFKYVDTRISIINMLLLLSNTEMLMLLEDGEEIVREQMERVQGVHSRMENSRLEAIQNNKDFPTNDEIEELVSLIRPLNTIS